ncbi:hypothetical protein BDZ91DRAFT_255491 [Kalaharituber pfeilii]|nr:hypothetical protein BDZ91DRAFT_255491 [Kalaharituber pfeilii]
MCILALRFNQRLVWFLPLSTNGVNFPLSLFFPSFHIPPPPLTFEPHQNYRYLVLGCFGALWTLKGLPTNITITKTQSTSYTLCKH